MLKQLIYASQAVRPVPQEELLRMLQGARERNQKVQITGMLVYREPFFLQALEGEGVDVDNLWAKIRADSRHTDIILLHDEPIGEREFADWSMGFVNLAFLPDGLPPGFSRILEEDFSPEELHVKPGHALDLLLGLKYCEFTPEAPIE